MNKRFCIIGLLVIGLTGSMMAQGISILEMGGGYLNPKGTQAGTILGASYGISVDERVDISLGLGYFHKNYEQLTEVADTSYASGVVENTVTKELEYSTTLLPISANVVIRIPFQPPLSYYVGGSLTYNFLFNNEKNFEEDISEKRTYKGFGWILRAGIDYSIGSRSSILIECLYNMGKTKRNVDETVKGLPVWDEVDISGLGIRAGLRLEFF